YRVHAEDVRAVLPQRPHTAHKYSVGKVLVIAGSRNLTGAPFMTAVSAMRAGAGAVVLAVPKSIHAPLIRKLTEVMIAPLEETEEGTIAPEALEALEQRLQWADVVALGPGLSQNPLTRKLVHILVQRIAQPLVLDADALGMMAYDLSILRNRRCATIMTPHVGELRLLTKLESEYIERRRVEVARTQARSLKCVLVLKGSPTVTATPEGHAYMNTTGNPGMATAGAGDVLTGIIASFVGQGMKPEQAAWSGVFVHGLAGDLAARKLGQRALMAMDIVEAIPAALQKIEAL
ncbi:MAG TPA: NAD(P)H-hydrate dehydratase, partial [Bacteroidota bacterium]|nr:NAD(P)H-hydrate dehydratase [Bacteroidota bacterium]